MDQLRALTNQVSPEAVTPVELQSIYQQLLETIRDVQYPHYTE